MTAQQDVASNAGTPKGENMAITIHTDGACIGNPGPGGFAAIIDVDDNMSITVTGGDPDTTNDRMELSAVVEALHTLNSMTDFAEQPVTVRSDSKYVVDAFNHHWVDNWLLNGWRTAKKQPVANQELWENLLDAIGNRQVTWQWVKGHSGDPENERCDRLANGEAHLAPQTTEYWVSVGNPRSVVEGRNSPMEPTPAPEHRVPTHTEALHILEAMSTALDKCDTFDEFQEHMRTVMQQAEW